MRPVSTRPKPKVFLDSSGLISAVITPHEGTPIYRLVMLGEANIIDLRISREVIGDVERFVRGRNPAMMPTVAALVDRGDMAVTAEPHQETIALCETLTGYRPDARILAAAIECAADVLVTYDGEHLLNNPRIKPPDVSVMVMTPKQCLEWCYEQWTGQRGP